MFVHLLVSFALIACISWCILFFSTVLILDVIVFCPKVYFELLYAGMILPLASMVWTSMWFWNALATVLPGASAASPVLVFTTESLRRMRWSGSKWNMREWSSTNLKPLLVDPGWRISYSSVLDRGRPKLNFTFLQFCLLIFGSYVLISISF